ncbi:sentrin-specific protease 1 isoform X3 [Austrofundulus limnaeus]|uniref:Sentrin-specific protease 1 isoform X3 n=1 Tax=Austrofundulus limnaeus TaxID=52670 RepID=A0A2I4C273_AUSLI|nr:PREDICTED: sentrin-specific protease 1-like isoform X3 [Austrofundulus limnaeus]
MLSKLYEFIETTFANNRNGEPAAEGSHGHPTPRQALLKRKRPIECSGDDHNIHQDDIAIKKSRIGDLIGGVKSAAEGVRQNSIKAVTWMKESVGPTWRNILPTSPDSPPGEPQPSTSAAVGTGRQIVDRNSSYETFAAPSTTLDWKTLKSESLHNEKFVIGSKVCRRQACMSSTHCEVPKTNGHSFNIPSITSKVQSPPRLGRPLIPQPHGTSSLPGGVETTNTVCTNMYRKSFPIKLTQSPKHGTMSSRLHKDRPYLTAEECICMEEKEIYRQLLALTSDGQSSSHHNGSWHTVGMSQRDYSSSFLTSRRQLQVSSPAGSAAGGTSEGPSSPLSPRDISSQSSSNLPSPVGASSKPETQTWSRDADLVSSRAAALTSAFSPSVLQDGTSQDSQSSAQDGDSVIIVNDQKGKKQDSSSLSWLEPERWIKELSSRYDSRARERRRLIEEQEAITAQLLKQRLFEIHRSPDVEVHVRVPLEKEVPLTPLVIEEPKLLEEKPEFPELTEEMEAEVDRVLMRGGSPHEVLSEGFGLSLTRKDFQTLSNLNWLNDEVINFYMNLLVERSKDPNMPSVNTFNTFFYPKLRSSGYSAVRRWTKRMDIFAKDLLLVPVHLGMHWCLSVVDFRKKYVTYFDSMGGRNDDACRLLFNYLKQESLDKKGKELDTSGWTLHSKKPSEIPQQMNGSDCGMFTCKYADYITRDKRITFTQKHMPYFRRRMVWEILKHTLL